MTVLKNIMNAAEAPLKSIAEHLLHINGVYVKEKAISNEISKLSKQSRSLHDDIHRKIVIVSNEVRSANLNEKMMAAILTTNWSFLTAAGTTPKVDIVVWYIKKHFASHDKLFKQEMESIGRTVAIDVKPIIKTLKDRNVLVLNKSYTCPECGSTMLPSDGRGVECDDCGEEFDSKRDLDREVWYEKGPNFYMTEKPIATPTAMIARPKCFGCYNKLGECWAAATNCPPDIEQKCKEATAAFIASRQKPETGLDPSTKEAGNLKTD